MDLNPLAGRDIICLASQSWDSHWATPQQICSRLARQSRVLYVEPLRSPLWALRNSGTQTLRRAGPAEQVMDSLWVLTLPPVFVPLELYRRMPALRRLNNIMMSLFVRRAAERLGLRDAIVWLYMITHQGAPLLRHCALLVYDCIDEWAGGTADVSLQQYFTQLDRQLCADCDVLFVGSRQLLAARHMLNDNHALVPQGVDLAHFLPPSDPQLARPPDMQGIQQPVIGLIGVLNAERIDIALLEHMARTHPEWSVVLIGPVWQGLDTTALARHANIHLLGNKPRAQLGRYLAAFDVCMLPYLINDFTRNIFPLKLFEYLAAGKPFVSTAVPACSEFPRLIRVASTHGEFVAAVSAALAEDGVALRDERIALARANDWEHRVADKSRIVARRLGHARAPQQQAAGSTP